LLFSLLCKALAAIDRTVLTGLEGDFGLAAALGAGGDELLALRAALGFAQVTAVLAALGLIYESLAGVELLLAGGENEFLATVFADESFVFEHFFYLA